MKQTLIIHEKPIEVLLTHICSICFYLPKVCWRKFDLYIFVFRFKHSLREQARQTDFPEEITLFFFTFWSILQEVSILPVSLSISLTEKYAFLKISKNSFLIYQISLVVTSWRKTTSKFHLIFWVYRWDEKVLVRLMG